ncbi:MAG: hypothetical protein H0V97_04200 [Actinobacteria bacterium]|nr:hypothetical protein [Actinomycetota bacterium]
MNRRLRLFKVAVAVACASLLASCTGGVDAGEEGGIAFIIFAVMLVGTVVVLWFVLGREE